MFIVSFHGYSPFIMLFAFTATGIRPPFFVFVYSSLSNEKQQKRH